MYGWRGWAARTYRVLISHDCAESSSTFDLWKGLIWMAHVVVTYAGFGLKQLQRDLRTPEA